MNEDDWAAAIEVAENGLGGFEVLVNNAGAFIQKSIEETTFEEYDRVMRVNVWGGDARDPVRHGLDEGADHDGRSGGCDRQPSGYGLNQGLALRLFSDMKMHGERDENGCLFTGL